MEKFQYPLKKLVFLLPVKLIFLTETKYPLRAVLACNPLKNCMYHNVIRNSQQYARGRSPEFVVSGPLYEVPKESAYYNV